MQPRSLVLVLSITVVPLMGGTAQAPAQNLELDGAAPGVIIAIANRGKVQDVGEASAAGSANLAWDVINFGKPPQELEQLAGQEVTAYDCDGKVVMVLEGEPVPEECDEDAVLAVFAWGQTATVTLTGAGGPPAGAEEALPGGQQPGGAAPDYSDKRGRFGIGWSTTLVRGGLGLNSLSEESLDGFCDEASEPCSVTTSQFGPELALELRLAVAQAVTAGLVLGWTDLDGAEIEIGDGSQALTGYFRANALFAQLALYFTVFESYPWLRPFVIVGLTRWSAESGSAAGNQSYSQEDSGSGALYGAGAAVTGFGPGEVLVTLRRTGLNSEEHEGAEVDNSVTQLQVGYALSLATIRGMVSGR